MQKWAYFCGLEALRAVWQHAKLSKAEQDWLTDFLKPSGDPYNATG